MDQTFFDAYNQCDMKKQEAIYAADIEFFHDKGGLMTSKKELLEATQKNICGKVTRILIPGSIEVYPINHYGAVEMGFHRFYNNQEPNAESKPSKFIIVWKKENELWRIAKVVSLH
ncbi:MAG: nuclear transport factor 2 family protein [Bacteroidetes bacterium]|nr:nuclear transport factor 2 family protein [Bacteroidota bacterium]